MTHMDAFNQKRQADKQVAADTLTLYMAKAVENAQQDKAQVVRSLLQAEKIVDAAQAGNLLVQNQLKANYEAQRLAADDRFFAAQRDAQARRDGLVAAENAHLEQAKAKYAAGVAGIRPWGTGEKEENEKNNSNSTLDGYNKAIALGDKQRAAQESFEKEMAGITERMNDTALYEQTEQGRSNAFVAEILKSMVGRRTIKEAATSKASLAHIQERIALSQEQDQAAFSAAYGVAEAASEIEDQKTALSRAAMATKWPDKNTTKQSAADCAYILTKHSDLQQMVEAAMADPATVGYNKPLEDLKPVPLYPESESDEAYTKRWAEFRIEADKRKAIRDAAEIGTLAEGVKIVHAEATDKAAYISDASTDWWKASEKTAQAAKGDWSWHEQRAADFDELQASENQPVDDRRFELAKVAMGAMMSNTGVLNSCTRPELVKKAMGYADEMLKQLGE